MVRVLAAAAWVVQLVLVALVVEELLDCRPAPEVVMAAAADYLVGMVLMLGYRSYLKCIMKYLLSLMVE